MGKAVYNIKTVEDFLTDHDTSHECSLLSTAYKGVMKPLEFKCNICGQNFSRTFHSLKKIKRYCCSNCSHSIGKRKFSLDDVKQFLKKNDIDHDCMLLSTSYVNAKQMLEFRCSQCGEIFTRNFAALRIANYYCCPACAMKRVGQKNNKYTEKEVADMLKEYDCILLDKYVNTITPVRC